MTSRAVRQSGSGDVDVVVLTALNLEYNAVRQYLTGLSVDGNPDPTLFEVGTLRDGTCRVALAAIGEGNPNAAALTERAITRFRPKVLLFVGIAGGLKDEVALGDVVVPSWVYDYHSGKDTPAGFLPRPRIWPASHRLTQVAQHVDRIGAWHTVLAGSPPPRVHFKPVAAGEVLIAADTGVKEQIRKQYEDVAAAEMESAGVARAAKLKEFDPVLTIRSISDKAGAVKSATDQEGWQPRAAAHAAAFAMSLVDELSRVGFAGLAPSGSAVRRRLAVGAALLAGVLGIAAYVIVRLGLAHFYGALGADAGELPISMTDIFGPILFGAAVGGVVLTVGLGAFLTGFLLVPWTEHTRAALPATALVIVLSTVAAGGLLFAPAYWLWELIRLAVVLIMFGACVKLARQRHAHFWAGFCLGLATVCVVLVLSGGTGRWLPSPWPLVVFGTTIAIVVVSLGWWLRVELRRRGPVRDAHTSPLATVSRLVNELLWPMYDIRGSMPGWQARRVVIGLSLVAALVGGGVLWQAVNWLEGRAEAGRAAAVYGYVPVEHGSLIMPVEVHPVTLFPRAGGSARAAASDPQGICQQPPRWSASLLARDGDLAWLLLRPLAGGTATTVVQIRLTDYDVRSAPPQAVPTGKPWTRPACELTGG